MMTRPAYVRQLAAELEMLSHGGTTSWGASGRGVPSSRPPTGESDPPHIQLLKDWDAHGDQVLPKWLDVLKQHKGGNTPRREANGSEDDWIIDDGRGQSPDVVAQRFRCTPTRVRRLRVARGLDAETGAVDLRSTVRDLRENGLTYRQVAERLGRSKSQVERVDKAA